MPIETGYHVTLCKWVLYFGKEVKTISGITVTVRSFYYDTNKKQVTGLYVEHADRLYSLNFSMFEV